ncbi:hypothetical protein AB0L41_25765 [Amycolatopsis mediterranei]|uniref:hypothetical protein n=1 Tax=Amycolatopsis mediterranei TaxID=33910 RepID=UPI0034248EF2
MWLLLFALLLIFGPIPFLLMGAATLSMLLAYGLPILGVLLVVWLICAIFSR